MAQTLRARYILQSIILAIYLESVLGPNYRILWYGMFYTDSPNKPLEMYLCKSCVWEPHWTYFKGDGRSEWGYRKAGGKGQQREGDREQKRWEKKGASELLCEHVPLLEGVGDRQAQPLTQRAPCWEEPWCVGRTSGRTVPKAGRSTCHGPKERPGFCCWQGWWWELEEQEGTCMWLVCIFLCFGLLWFPENYFIEIKMDDLGIPHTQFFKM